MRHKHPNSVAFVEVFHVFNPVSCFVESKRNQHFFVLYLFGWVFLYLLVRVDWQIVVLRHCDMWLASSRTEGTFFATEKKTLLVER